MATKYSRALIVGSGSGLSASLAQLFAREGFKIALAARNTEKLASLCDSTGAATFSCDASDPDQVTLLSGMSNAGLAILMSLSTTQAPDLADRSFPLLHLKSNRPSGRVRLAVPCRPAGGKAHGGKWPWCNFVYRSVSEHKGLCAVSTFRHGQICAPWPRPKYGP